MTFRFLKILFLALLAAYPASAGTWEYDYGGSFRAIPAYTHLLGASSKSKNDYKMPDSAKLKNELTYNFDNDTTLTFHLSLKADAGTTMDNLNHGKWGQEAYTYLNAPYGEFYIGQMPNVAAELGINRPNLPTWQTSPEDIADFINNPNWRQRNHTKYYNTLNSTLINTDGSSLKFSYLTPEYFKTTLGLSYTPQNNANDSLNSKFSPYYKNEGYTIAAYNHQEFSYFDMETYIAYAHFEKSHSEQAGGISFYRKGWTLFGSYRQTKISSSDYDISYQYVSYNRKAGYDGYRDAKAFNAGIGYEFAFFNTTLSYFQSTPRHTSAKNRIINWHNSVKPYKNLGFYGGLAWVDFRSIDDNINHNKRGLAFYAGAEISF